MQAFFSTLRYQAIQMNTIMILDSLKMAQFFLITFFIILLSGGLQKYR